MQARFIAALVGLTLTAALTAMATSFRAEAKGPQPAGKLFVVGVLSGVHAVDLKTGKQLAVFDTGHIPHNLLASKDGRYVYVTNVGSQSVTVIDAQKLKRVKEILVGSIPDLPAHRKLPKAELARATSCYYCHSDKALGSLPNAISWAGDGRHILVNESRGRSVDFLDPASGKTVARHTFELPTPSTPANMAVAPKTGEVWVLHRFEAYGKSETALNTTRVTSMADFAHDPPAGQHFSWVTVHDRGMTRELTRIKLDMAVPFGYVFSPDGRYLYVAYRSADQIAVFDTQKRKLVRRFPVGVTPTGLAMSPDGKALYVSCVFSRPAVVQVVDPQKGTVVESLGIPPSPELVKVDPATGYVYVTAAGTNAVLEIDVKNHRLLRRLPAGHQPLDLVLVP
jgi:YVTN family beta-propeller protein